MGRLLFLCVALALAGCATMPPSRADERAARKEERLAAREERSEAARLAFESSPCNDSLYAVLQGRSLDSLTDREYRYFMEKERQCGEWRTDEQKPKQGSGGLTAWGVVGVVFTSLFVIGLLASAGG